MLMHVGRFLATVLGSGMRARGRVLVRMDSCKFMLSSACDAVWRHPRAHLL